MEAIDLSDLDILFRLLAAAICGMLIGLEREAKDRPAGFRTYMLVAMGAAGFSLAILGMVAQFAGASHISIDPSRVVQGIVGGIGFLGAGAIIQSKSNSDGHIKGIATGAGIWVAGAIGIACGFGYFVLAAMLTGITIFVLFVLQALKKLYSN